MKKVFNFVLSTLLVISLFASMSINSFAATEVAEGSYIVNNHEVITLRNPIANAQTISGNNAKTEIESAKDLAVAYINASEVADFAEIINICKDNGVVPTFVISSNSEADGIISAMNSTSCNDVTVTSANASVLNYIREKNNFLRSGLIIDLQKSTLTSEEANEIRKTVRSAPATFCVIKSENATKQAVSELQELAVGVWVEIESEPDTDAFAIEAAKAITSGANGIISKNASDVTTLINSVFVENTMTRTPIMIGHRGNPTQAPENSISGFLTAYENGADIFEIDVDITSDKEIVIIHDGNLKRTTTYDSYKTIPQMTLAEIKEYNLLAKDGSVTDEKVPTLRELFDVFKDKDCRIFIEFKGANSQTVPRTAAIIKEYGMEDRVDIISFSNKFLTQLQSELPGMSTGLLYSCKTASDTYKAAVKNLIECSVDPQKYKSTLNVSEQTYSVYFQQAAADRGITVWPWTYNASNCDTPFISGCDGLTTDDVQWAKDMAKYLETDFSELSIEAGTPAEVTVSAVTYGNNTEAITSDKLTVSVIAGADSIRIDEATGKVIGLKNGTATVIYGYQTTTTSGSEYVLYTQPVTINVTGEEVTDDNSGDMIIYIIIGVAAVAVIGGIVLFVIKRNKK